MREVPCPACNGTRLKPEILAVTVEGRSIAEIAALSIGEANQFFRDMQLTGRDQVIAERVLKEVHARLGFLVDVGLDYLSLDRAAATLAGERRSASDWPRRSGPASSACCTSWTSPRSGCTSATTAV